MCRCFEAVNDNISHEKGDEALKEWGDTVKAIIKGFIIELAGHRKIKVTAYRPGGDEIGIICENTRELSDENFKRAVLELAQRLTEDEIVVSHPDPDKKFESGARKGEHVAVPTFLRVGVGETFESADVAELEVRAEIYLNAFGSLDARGAFVYKDDPKIKHIPKWRAEWLVSEEREYHEMMRQQNLQSQLETLAKTGVTAIDRFEAYTAEPTRAVFDMSEVSHALFALPSVSNQVAFIHEQIEMRTLGLGWGDLTMTISMGDDESQEQLTALAKRLVVHLKEVLIEEKVRFRNGFEVPAEAPMPDMQRKTEKQLSTPTAGMPELAHRSLVSPEQIRAASQRERERCEAAGFIDGVRMVMPHEAPPLDETLVGTQLEVCWGIYNSTEDGSNIKIWCPCVVKRIAADETDGGVDGEYFTACVCAPGSSLCTHAYHCALAATELTRLRHPTALKRTHAYPSSIPVRPSLQPMLATTACNSLLRCAHGRRASSRHAAWCSSSGRPTRSVASPSRRSCGCCSTRARASGMGTHTAPGGTTQLSWPSAGSSATEMSPSHRSRRRSSGGMRQRASSLLDSVGARCYSKAVTRTLSLITVVLSCERTLMHPRIPAPG